MKVSITVLLLLLTVQLTPATDWEWVYPRHAPRQPHIIEVAPDGSIWAMTYGQSSQFLKSVDQGHTFDTISAIDGQIFGGIAPFSADVAIAWQGDGYNYKTSNGGKTWSRFMFKNEPHVNHLSYSSDGGLWAASDGGILEFVQHDVEPIIHPIADVDTAFYHLKVSEDFIVCLSRNKLWYRARTNPDWHRHEARADQSIYGFELAGAMIYLKTSDSVIIVDASANTVHAISDSIYGETSTRDGKHLVSISNSMCATSNDTGLTWTVKQITPNDVLSYAWITDTSLIAFSYIGERLLSTDRGASWSPHSSRVPSFEIFQIGSNGVMYGLNSVLTRAHRSDDLGDSWTLIASNPLSDLSMLYVDDDASFQFVNDSVWYLQHHEYFYRTRNAGKDWDTVSGEWYKECFIRIGSDTLYAFERLYSPFVTKHHSTKVFRSTNNGAEWSTVYSSDTQWTEAAFLSNGLIILSSGSSTRMVSRDGGDTWHSESIKSVKSFGLSKDGSQWGTKDSDNLTKGVYITTDNGISWQQTLSAGYCDVPIHVRDNTFLVSCSDGIFQSDDNGANWHKLDFPGSRHTLQLGLDGKIYAADTETLYRFSISPATSVDDSTSNPNVSQDLLIDRVQIYSLTGSLFATVRGDEFDDVVVNQLPTGLWICVEQTTSGSWVSKKIAVY